MKGRKRKRGLFLANVPDLYCSFVEGVKHMGEPESFAIVLKWLFKLLDVPGDVGKFLATIPFKPKY